MERRQVGIVEEGTQYRKTGLPPFGALFSIRAIGEIETGNGRCRAVVIVPESRDEFNENTGSRAMLHGRIEFARDTRNMSATVAHKNSGVGGDHTGLIESTSVLFAA